MSWLQTQGTARNGSKGSGQEGTPAASAANLTMYDDPPPGDISLEDIERCAIQRLRVLKGLEDARARGLKGERMQSLVSKLCRENLEQKGETPGWADSVGHYVLRLAYCRTEELRRWFLVQETDLFRFRFQRELPSAQVEFMQRQRMPYDLVEEEEYEELVGKLQQVQASQGRQEFANEIANGSARHSFFKVAFERVPDLVAMRKVLLVRGWAYVSRYEVASLVGSHFRSHLSQALTLTSRKWASYIAAQEADRLAPLVEALSTRYLGPDYGDEGASKEVVTAAQIPVLARTSFPLCMQRMYDHLHSVHHLKHTGRMQLGLFLKGIGLPLEEALRFWRTEFAPVTPSDKFDKEYAYNVRHNYGVEGKRTSYTPYSCVKIISTPVDRGTCAGCPYKVLAADELSASLSKLRIGPRAAQDVVAKAKAGHYQLACALAWEAVHATPCDTGINHPNQYYAESRKALAAKAEEEAATQSAAGTPQTVSKGGGLATPATAMRPPLRALQLGGDTPATAPARLQSSHFR
eukprot:jgi/Botrbrau1/3427/Bobra.139_1s0007.1